MAGIFLHAWKSHILQDFQFPQRFPQQTAGLSRPKIAARRREALAKSAAATVL